MIAAISQSVAMVDVAKVYQLSSDSLTVSLQKLAQSQICLRGWSYCDELIDIVVLHLSATSRQQCLRREHILFPVQANNVVPVVQTVLSGQHGAVNDEPP